MTATGFDGIFIGNDGYAITNCTERIDFNPESYGIKACMFSTANHQGYYCEYEIADGRLHLRSLYTYNAEGVYPPLNGVDPILPKAWYDDAAWEDVRLPIDYTGFLVLCDDSDENFLSEYYNHMGYQPVFMHKRAMGVAFEGGRVVGEFDLSPIVDHVRSMYDGEGESDEAWRIRRQCSWTLGFMRYASGPCRVAVDRYYEDRFKAEQAVLRRVIDGEPLCDSGRVLYGGYELVPYAPAGLTPIEIRPERLAQLIEDVWLGRMGPDEIWALTVVLRSCANGLEHFALKADQEKLDDLCDELAWATTEIEHGRPCLSPKLAQSLRALASVVC